MPQLNNEPESSRLLYRKGIRLGVLLSSNAFLWLGLAFGVFSDAGTGFFKSKCSPNDYKYHSPFSFVTDYFGFKYGGHSSNWIDRHILYRGAFERPVLSFMEEALKSLQLVGKAVAVDVGAYTGTHSLFLSRFAKEVHAFEPSPKSFARIERAVLENEIDNIKVHPEALGDKNEVLPFYESSSGNSLVSSFRDDFDAGNTVVREMKVVRGDDKFEELGVQKVHLMKIHVEGFERPVLEGLRETLKISKPLVLLELTIGKQDSFKNLTELRRAFPSGYSLHTFRTSVYKTFPDFSVEPIEEHHFKDKGNKNGNFRVQLEVVAVPDEYIGKIKMEFRSS